MNDDKSKAEELREYWIRRGQVKKLLDTLFALEPDTMNAWIASNTPDAEVDNTETLCKAKELLEYVLAHWTDPGTYTTVDEARGLLNEVV